MTDRGVTGFWNPSDEGVLIVCTAATHPSGPAKGQQIYETDTNKFLIYNGVAWQPPWNLPWGELAYAEITATSAAIGTTITDITGLSVTVTVPANRILKITAHGLIVASANTSQAVGYIREGATEFGRWAQFIAGSGVADRHIQEGSVRITPTAGSHTYVVSLQCATTGTASITATATLPAFIQALDMGPAGVPA